MILFGRRKKKEEEYSVEGVDKFDTLMRSAVIVLSEIEALYAGGGFPDKVTAYMTLLNNLSKINSAFLEYGRQDGEIREALERMGILDVLERKLDELEQAGAGSEIDKKERRDGTL